MAMEKSDSALDAATIQDFRSRLRGRALESTHAEYEDARKIQNGLIDRRPAVIVRCSGVADVVEAVNFARDRGLLLSIRGGGHNVAGNAINDGGVVIDLSSMRGMHVDVAAATQSLHDQHRGIFLFYPVREQEADAVSVGFELLFPRNNIPFDLNFTFRRKAESAKVVVEESEGD